MGDALSVEIALRVPQGSAGIFAYLASRRVEFVILGCATIFALRAPAVGDYSHARDLEPIAVTPQT